MTPGHPKRAPDQLRRRHVIFRFDGSPLTEHWRTSFFVVLRVGSQDHIDKCDELDRKAEHLRKKAKTAKQQAVASAFAPAGTCTGVPVGAPVRATDTPCHAYTTGIAPNGNMLCVLA